VPAVSGNNGSTTPYNKTLLHFRGHKILRAVFSALAADPKFGLSGVTSAVLAGCSAGGLATFHHADEFAEFIDSATHGRAKVSQASE